MVGTKADLENERKVSQQKANELQPIPFVKAINFKENIHYLKYALIPICIWGIILFMGIHKEITNSFQRVVDYKTAYSPPAPFAFSIENKSLYVHANVRLGRSQKQIDQLCEIATKGCAKILQVGEDKIHINLMEISGKWAMEGGFVMPDPGEEDEWMEKVTRALEERESAAV